MSHRGTESARLGRAVLTIGLVVAMCCASFVTLMAVAVGADVMPTIASDQVDYAPGGTVQLTGTGWQSGESVRIVVNDTVGQTWQRDVTVVADPDGVVLDAFDLPGSFIANYDVTATGVSGVTTTTFTDSAIQAFDQCENNLGTGFTSGDLGCRWSNGALQSSNSRYVEGDSTVQRVWMDGLTPGSTHTLTLEYDTTKSGKHGYDYLTTWDASENWITVADRCQDITGCATVAESAADIPDDPAISIDPTAPGARQFVMRGGTLGGTPTTPTLVSGTYAADSTTAITLSFTVANSGDMCTTKVTGPNSTTTCGVALWFGAHLAQQLDWAPELGASSIAGAPVHVSTATFDNDPVGRRDNAINDVGGSGALILAKSLTGGPDGYTGPFTIHYNCGAFGSDDRDVPAGGSATISGIPTGTQCTVTEPTLPSPPPTGYSFGTPTYTDSSGTANDGIVMIVAAATVTVTTNNTLTRDTGTLTISKTLSNPDGASVPASYTVNYNCGTGFTGSRTVTTSTSATVTGIPTGNSCSVTEVAPAAIAGFTWAAATYSPASIVISSTSGTFEITVQNAISRDTGTLTISKTLSNPDGASVPASYSVNYNCGTGFTGSRTVTTSTSATVTGIPTGNTCTVTEVAPATIAGFTWAAATYSPASIVIGSTSGTFAITVQNAISHDRGTLTIKKTLSNPDGAAVPASYSVNYNCGAGFTGSRTVTTSTPATVTGIPTGNSCSVTEVAPAAIAGFTWAAATYSPASIVIGSTSGTFAITVQNAISHDRGTLTIKKTLSNPDGAAVPASYSVNYNCGAGYTGSRSVSTSTPATVTGIPTGNSCSVTEVAPAAIAGFTWAAATYSPASIVIGSTSGTFAITVQNAISRDRGTLTIKKTLSNPDGASVPASYTVNYNCGAGYTGSRTVSTSTPATVTGIPTGNSCSVTEAALAPIAGFAWSAPTYTPASIVISSTSGTFAITVQNVIRRDNTPPACALTQTIPGPPTQMKVTTSDSSSGIKSIVVTKAINTSVSIPSFAVGTTSAIVVTGTKVNQSLASELALQVTDVAGNVTNCDPVIVNALGLTKTDITNVPTAEHVVTVMNGNPGLATVAVKVNGKQFVMSSLKAGETRNIDIASALLPGDTNAISLSATGNSKGSATVIIWDGV